MYLEEGMLHAGFYADYDLPRVRELIYIFGIFRAARVPADVWLQRNEMTVSEVVDYWRELTPYLDPDVARVDAEIYLRRPPGYGLGYTMGLLQMQRLLADVRQVEGEDFTLKAFHDEFMGLGRLPLSLIRVTPPPSRRGRPGHLRSRSPSRGREFLVFRELSVGIDDPEHHPPLRRGHDPGMAR